MTPWEWKIFSDKERYDMYQASKNLVQLSNERVVKYEKEASKIDKQIKEQTDKLDATQKEIKVLQAGKDEASMKVLVAHSTKEKDAEINDQKKKLDDANSKLDHLNKLHHADVVKTIH